MPIKPDVVLPCRPMQYYFLLIKLTFTKERLSLLGIFYRPHLLIYAHWANYLKVESTHWKQMGNTVKKKKLNLAFLPNILNLNDVHFKN